MEIHECQRILTKIYEKYLKFMKIKIENQKWYHWEANKMQEYYRKYSQNNEYRYLLKTINEQQRLKITDIYKKTLESIKNHGFTEIYNYKWNPWKLQKKENTQEWWKSKNQRIPMNINENT